MEFGLKTTQTEKDTFQEQIRKKYLDTLIENLENRFSESELLNAFITLFRPVNVLKVKEKSAPNFAVYGDASIDTLAKNILQLWTSKNCR